MRLVIPSDAQRLLASTTSALSLLLAFTGLNAWHRAWGEHISQPAAVHGQRGHQPPPAPPSREGGGLTAEEILTANRHRFVNATFAARVNHDELLFLLSAQVFAKTRTKAPRILIHFDYHSDLYRNDSHLYNKPNIGNFVNFLIYQRLVDEVWWVIPDQSRSTQRLSTERGCATINSQNELYWGRPKSFVDWQFRDGPPDQKICVSPSGSFQFKASSGACTAGDRVVHFKKRTLSDILVSEHPPFKGTVILDIDADFFDHSGFYANEHPTNKWINIGPNPRCYSYHLTSQQLELELSRFAQAVTSGMDLYPDYIFVSQSPEYATGNTDRLHTFFSTSIFPDQGMPRIQAAPPPAPAQAEKNAPRSYPCRSLAATAIVKLPSPFAPCMRRSPVESPASSAVSW